MAEAGPRHLFVYGTLRRGSEHPMARWLAGVAVPAGPARVPGVLYDLGRYPGMALSASADAAGGAAAPMVIGDLFELPGEGAAAVMDRLDRYEGIGSVEGPDDPYRRLVVTALTPAGQVPAWCYVLAEGVPGAPRIASGEWSGARP